MNTKIRIFIAGSTTLADRMDLFRVIANRLSVEFDCLNWSPTLRILTS